MNVNAVVDFNFTYERDSGSVRSWIDHVLCRTSHGSLITCTKYIESPQVLPSQIIFPSHLTLMLHFCSHFHSPIWPFSGYIQQYCYSVSDTLPSLSLDVEYCCVPLFITP